MFYITVSNGLLTEEHKKRMGIAVWEFMWCIDKVTRIDKSGWGLVLGGKPIKLSEIGMGHDNTVSRNLIKLEEEGYIKVTHAPYGLIIRVAKAKKRFNKSSESLKPVNHQKLEPPLENGEPPLENGEPNKIVSVDKTVDRVADRNEEVFPLFEELEKLRLGKRVDYKIIALYLRKKGWQFENKKQFNAALRRELRPAKLLEGYDGEQINATMEFCKKQYAPNMWTLETVGKRIEEVVLVKK